MTSATGDNKDALESGLTTRLALKDETSVSETFVF